MTENIKNDNKNKPLFSGKVAFTLYDTYGFPLDLTQAILREKGIEVNIEEFEAEMAEQKKKAKEAWVGSGDVKNSKIYFDVKEKIQPTEFYGYEKNTIMGKILAIIKDGKEVEEVKEGDEFEFFVDKTTFYGESGGQVGDTGLAIQIKENGVIPLPFSTIEITDVKRPFPHYFLHKGKMESGKIKVGDYVNLSINVERRNKIRANHSSAHLLQYALRKIYGNTVMQKGSYVDDSRLRFDFTLSKGVGREQIEEIENIVNDLIYKNTKVETKIMNLDDAKNSGAMALFNEKYEDKVRVLFMGEKSHEDIVKEKKNYDNLSNNSFNDVSDGLTALNNSSLKSVCSIELCGGTHVSKTGEIGLFKIVSEGAISAGVRRIEAVTGLEAIKYMNKFQNIVKDLDDVLQSGVDNVVDKVNSLVNENKTIKKQLNDAKKSNMSKIEFREIDKNGVLFAYTLLRDTEPKDAKGNFINLQNQKYNSNAIAVCISNFENKLSIMIGISKDLNDKYKANEIIKKAVQVAGGNGGGGQPWFAMGGATLTENLDDIFKKVVNAIADEIK